MAGQGLCCSSLEQPKALMKMGLSVILIGHVNFMLAALVQGIVLRHINFQKHHRALEHAFSTVMALTAGLVTWSVFVLSLTAALLAGASAIGLFIAVVIAIQHRGRILLSHCRFPDTIDYFSITNECPFDPTRIYSTTLILWLPLIVTSVVQLVFCSQCFAVCVSFLGLPCCHCCRQKKRPRSFARSINVVKPLEAESPFSPPRTSTLSPPRHPPGRTSRTSSSRHSAPPLVQYVQSPTRPSHARPHSTLPARTRAPTSARPHREVCKQQACHPSLLHTCSVITVPLHCRGSC
uniref:Transmembrane protein 54b n=1 Tax=Neogobius melanostomus TaxID=47308 RepID=A0A8C6TIG6_9GOBI